MKREAFLERTTKETSISLYLCLDGSGKTEIDTGIGFFDHMLTALAFHGRFDLKLKALGDLAVDMHHTVEDVGILLGKALAEAAKGTAVRRYGTAFVPMDEALARTVLDVSGRSFLCFDGAGIDQKYFPGFDGALVAEFLRALSSNAGITLHSKIEYGSNAHHMAEACFKSLGQALRQGYAPSEEVMSTKGLLD
ncbi:MAG: imidazoleglycerol-phosphate dehydratase HisB [Clostridiales bacterium]|nr:imidazoleglycerol-phosphate dehydratase HisB [Clostridiales bacterium]